MKKLGMSGFKGFIWSLVGLVIVGFIAMQFGAGVMQSLSELPRLNYQQVFEPQEDDYLVYFYAETCSFCQQLAPSVLELANAGEMGDGTPIAVYAVDMSSDANQAIWYDWEAHHAQYDRVIGTVSGGFELLHEGEDKALYPTNEGWSIETVGDELVATHNTAYPNTTPTSPDELQVAGTPTLLYFHEGVVEAYTGDYNAAYDLIQTLQGE